MRTFKQHLQEKNKTKSNELPPSMLLRRIAIRTFPDNKNVALYRDTKTNTDYAIPPAQD